MEEPDSPELFTPQSPTSDNEWIGDWEQSQFPSEAGSQEDMMSDWDMPEDETPPPFHNVTSMKGQEVKAETNVVTFADPIRTDLETKLPIGQHSQSSQAVDLNDVMLDPTIFRQARKELNFKPSVDLFASDNHHQLPRYHTADPQDTKAVVCDAFKFNWLSELYPYINPPWDDIQACLTKIKHDKVKAMLVIPEWPNAPWWPDYQRLSVKEITYDTPIYLDNRGVLRPKQRWRTNISIVDGRYC